MTLINTSKGSFYFEKPAFEYASKKINPNIAKENLFLFKEILDKSKVKFFLAYGTLLGAIREGNFIEHDFDTDFIILEEDRSNFLDLLFELRDKGFVVGRYQNDLISLIRKNEYIDIYIFKKYLFKYRKSAYNADKSDIHHTYNRFFIQTTMYNFLGGSFLIPKDYVGYLENCYGKNWRTPIENQHGEDFILYHKIKSYIKKPVFIVFFLRKKLKNFYPNQTEKV